MSGSGRFLLALIIAAATSGAAAQDSEADAGARALAEQAREIEQESERQQVRTEEIDVELREAEERLAEAAARIAELSQRRLPAMIDIERRMRVSNRPMLGVTIGAEDNRGPVEGVTIQGVTPGSAAAESGLRAGDVITAVNDESLSAGTDEVANRKLLDFLEGVEEGDTLDVEYLRDGKNAAVEVKPRTHRGHVFAFGPSHEGFMMRSVPGAPAAPGADGFSFRILSGGSWSDMEMVSLTRDLGQYFGTDEGLLVVRAPSDEQLKLRDGDVIQRIDGREPTSVSHAMRILGSYQGGETLRVEIMRNRKKETVSIEIPDNRRSFAPEFEGVVPAPDDVAVIDTRSGNEVVKERT